MNRERESESDSLDGIRERFPAIRRKDRDVDWRERERRRDSDQHANGKPSISAELVNKKRKGDTFPRMTKPITGRDRKIPNSEYDSERHMGRPKEILYENERERERRRRRDVDMQNDRERERFREEWRRNEFRKDIKEEPAKQRERRELDPGRGERRRGSLPGVNDHSGTREREMDRDRERLREREVRNYPKVKEREIDNFSDREWRTDRPRDRERYGIRDAKSEGDLDGKRNQGRYREEDDTLGHKHHKSEGDNDGERKAERVRGPDRQREREGERRRDVANARGRNYREMEYMDEKGMKDFQERKLDRYPERGQYREDERRRDRDRYSERELEERNRRRRVMERSGHDGKEPMLESENENERRRRMRENPEARSRGNNSESDKDMQKGRMGENLVMPGKVEECEVVEKKAQVKIRKLWLEPRNERKDSELDEQNREREKARQRYNQRYYYSSPTVREEGSEGTKKKKSREDKYRELEKAGEFQRDIERNRKEGDVEIEQEVLEPEMEMEGENMADNCEDPEEERVENSSDYLRNEEEVVKWEVEKDRIISNEDGFVTMSSGGDDADEEDFEDCNEFWNNGQPVSEQEGATHGVEVRINEEKGKGTSDEEEAPKEPLKVFCVIAQTAPEPQDSENAETTVEEVSDQQEGLNIDHEGETMTVQGVEELEEGLDMEKAVEDLSLSPHDNIIEGVVNKEQETEGRESPGTQSIPLNEISEDAKVLPPETLETSQPRSNHSNTEVHSEDAMPAKDKEPTGDMKEHIDKDDQWASSEDQKRCSAAPHIKWATNVMKELLDLNPEDTETMRGTHIDMQTNTQTETEGELTILGEEEEVIGGKQQVESDEESSNLNPGTVELMVSSEGEADSEVAASSRKDGIKKCVLSSRSFQDMGNEVHLRRRGFLKKAPKTHEEEHEEEDEERKEVGRDRRTRVFNISDDEEHELCFNWSEEDLRNVGKTRKRNSKFFNSQLYQVYSEVVQNREIQLSHTDSISVHRDNLSIHPSESPNHSSKLSGRLLATLSAVTQQHSSLFNSIHTSSLPLPQQSFNRPPSPRLSISASSPTLWQDLPGVRNSPEVQEITEDERRLQEVRFEVVTSEASYCRSLDIVVENFVMSKQLNAILSLQDKNWLFSRLISVRTISHNFLAQLEKSVEKDIMHFTLCDIIIKYCPQFRAVYVPYLTNQSYQDKTYQRLMDESQEFRHIVEKLERNPVCQRLPLRSFLILPFQRITRLKLLVQNIVKRTAPKTKDEAQAIKAMKLLEKIIQDSNENISQMKNIESLVTLNAKVDFECRTLPLISQSRRLVREGPVTEFRDFSLKDREEERRMYIHLFNDYLLFSLRKEGGRFTVIDHAPVSELRVKNCKFKLHSQQKNMFQLYMPQKALVLRTDTQADKLRWISALSRPYPEINFSAVQDVPQVQCIRAYMAQQPDELSLEKADVLLVHEQSTDGWVEGTRLSDRQRGWAPESHLETIVSDKARKRNLQDTMKIATAAVTQ